MGGIVSILSSVFIPKTALEPIYAKLNALITTMAKNTVNTAKKTYSIIVWALFMIKLYYELWIWIKKHRKIL